MSREVLSTHLTKLGARRAQEHYEAMQHAATLEGPAGEYARRQCAQLGIGLTGVVKIERARHERARWVVMLGSCVGVKLPSGGWRETLV